MDIGFDALTTQLEGHAVEVLRARHVRPGLRERGFLPLRLTAELLQARVRSPLVP